jgi:hypothetical protein
MITTILRLSLFLLIIVAFLCFYDFESKESFTDVSNSDNRKRSLLAYLKEKDEENDSKITKGGSTKLSDLKQE